MPKLYARAPRMWTKAQYIKWKETRGPEGSWKIEDCRAADALIRKEAIGNLRATLKNKKIDKSVINFVAGMAVCHFGSVEVDVLITALKAYPDWI